jgi:hypothetical protein
MKNAKSVIAFVFLVILFVTAAWAEYDLAMHFRIASSVASVCGLIALLGALLRAPEGYEDETGFHIGALADAGLLKPLSSCPPTGLLHFRSAGDRARGALATARRKDRVPQNS